MKPHILFICTDQHRFDSLKCYNPQSIAETPNLDSLAEDSLVFRHCYTSNPVCTPARSSLQLGRYPSKHGMDTNLHQVGCVNQRIPESEYPRLLSKCLSSLGYRCTYTGKWHLGDQPQDLPTALSYEGDDFPGHGAGGWNYPQYRQYLEAKGLELQLENVVAGTRPGDHTTTGLVMSGVESTVEHFLVERSMDLIDGLGEGPFFHSLHFWGPHEPFFPPAEYYNKYKDRQISPWPTFSQQDDNPMHNILRHPEKAWPWFENALRHYYAYIEFIDFEIGRLLNYLKSRDLYEKTCIIFSSDHGDYQGVHGALENKSYGMYDDITRIPLLLKGAGLSDLKGFEEDALVGSCDIYASICHLVTWPADRVEGSLHTYGDGRSLLPFLQGTMGASKAAFCEIVTEGMGAFEAVCTQRMYRNQRYKYVGS